MSSYSENHPNSEALIAICLFSAFSDGSKCETERQRIDALALELGDDDVPEISRRILMGRLSLDIATAALKTREERLLAYEMARAVCESGGSISPDEQTFLSDLSSKLGMTSGDTKQLDEDVDAVALAPFAAPSAASVADDQSGMILRYAILNGALELLPETVATMAIIPMQMKMVWRIGKAHGHDLNRSSIIELLGTAGIGIGSQVLEGFARKLMGGFGKKLGGKLAGRVANQATGSAFSFASTYAIGHLAVKYYSAGRTFGSSELKSLYAPLANEAKTLHARYLPEIQQKAGSLDTATILNFVRGKTTV
jgi:uncharacterized protein (DUF697 family)/tellurite resistance protein